MKIFKYKKGQIVDVFHWGEPGKMKVVGYRPQTNQVELQYFDGPFGGCFYTEEELDRMKDKVAGYKKQNRKHDPELFSDMNYDDTDCLGRNYSDADPGL